MAEFKMPRFKYKGEPIPLDDCYRQLSEMSYKSPIEVVSQGFEVKLEGEIFKAIYNYGINVDKDELIKALQYDRNQYQKGFIDGCKGYTSTIEAKLAREIFEEIDRYVIRGISVHGDNLTLFNGKNYAELKKKYTEENDMARYIDADKLVERLKVSTIFQDFGTDGYFIRDMVIDLVGCRPTADVVPRAELAVQSFQDAATIYSLSKKLTKAKSEVERLVHILDCYALQHGTVTEQQEVIDKAKAEVAREIFEEIEEVISRNLYLDINAYSAYAELKKKYTEDITHKGV